MGYIYLFTTILLGVISQVIFRVYTFELGVLPGGFAEKVFHIFKLIFFTPQLLLGMFFTFMGGVFWLLALTKFELSYAYPFTGLAFVLIICIDVVFFGANLNFSKAIGSFLVFAGLVLLSR